MSIQDILSARGIAQETIEGIVADMKQHGVYTASEENLDIRYGKLKTQHEGVSKQLNEANALINELKNSSAGAEGLREKVAEYENKVAQMALELEKARTDAAVKVALLSGKAKDVDYLTFKLSEKLKKDGETLALDENGGIKGWEEKLQGLKTQFPGMFEDGSGAGGLKLLEENKLKKGSGEKSATKEQFRTMGYEERIKLQKENPELFRQLMR